MSEQDTRKNVQLAIQNATIVAEIKELVRPHREAGCQIRDSFCHAVRATPFPPIARLGVNCDAAVLMVQLLDRLAAAEGRIERIRRIANRKFTVRDPFDEITERANALLEIAALLEAGGGEHAKQKEGVDFSTPSSPTKKETFRRVADPN